MPQEIQHLRCKVNFQALAFVPHITALGDALVHRLRYPPSNVDELGANYLGEIKDKENKEGAGKFVAIHLRFDKVWSIVEVFIILKLKFRFT